MVSTTRRVLSLLLVLGVLGVPAAFAQAPSVVHAFDGVVAGNPAAGLTLGADGFLYGTNAALAPNGAVFRVRPNGTGFEVLHTFALPAGVVPSHAALARGAGGVFYGTTLQGGAGGRGTVYRLAVGPGGATVTTLHALVDPDAHPDGGVILASDGLLYGTFGAWRLASSSRAAPGAPECLARRRRDGRHQRHRHGSLGLHAPRQRSKPCEQFTRRVPDGLRSEAPRRARYERGLLLNPLRSAHATDHCPRG